VNWIHELSKEEIEACLDKDVQLINQECGLETLLILWEKMAGLHIYISEKSLFKVKEIYIRQKYKQSLDGGEPFDKKQIAVYLKISEKTVERALASTEVKDDRQLSLLQ